MGRINRQVNQGGHPKPDGYIMKAWRTLFGDREGEELSRTLKFAYEKLGRGSRQDAVRIFYRNRRARVIRAWRVLFGSLTMEGILQKIREWNKKGLPIPTVEIA